LLKANLIANKIKGITSPVRKTKERKKEIKTKVEQIRTENSIIKGRDC
jgi:hypothetical protein